MDRVRRERDRKERDREEKDRDRWGTGTSNNGRTKGNDYVQRKKCRGVAGDVIPSPFAVDKDYLGVPVTPPGPFLNWYRRPTATTRGSSV
jgi:hypothetical protein